MPAAQNSVTFPDVPLSPTGAQTLPFTANFTFQKHATHARVAGDLYGNDPGRFRFGTESTCCAQEHKTRVGRLERSWKM